MSIESYEDIAHMIEGYFGQLIHVGNLSKAIPNLIDAEMNFFHFMKKKSADGFIVTNGYQKALETVIEATITS